MKHRHKHHRHHHRRRCGGGWKGRMLGMGLGAIALTALLVMLIWNALIPDLFGGPALSYLQALGLLVLSRLLVGGWRGGGRWRGRRGHWREKLRRKMEDMSPEERAQFKAGFREAMRGKWGKWDVNVWEVEVEEEDTGEHDADSPADQDRPEDDTPPGDKPEA